MTELPAALAVDVGTMAVLGARDPGSTRVVYAVVIALAVLGAGLAVLAWWLVRATRPDPELLAPLEVMERRQWRRLDPAGRRRLLDEHRPVGAEPTDRAPEQPDSDEAFDDEPAPKDVRELGDDHWQRWDRALGLLPPVAAGAQESRVEIHGTADAVSDSEPAPDESDAAEAPSDS